MNVKHKTRKIKKIIIQESLDFWGNMSYVVSMNNTEELNTILQREVAELHQSIGGLIARIESLEKQKECLVKVGNETSENFDILKDKFYAKMDEAGFLKKGDFLDSLPKFSDVAKDALEQDAQFDEACLQADIRSDD